MIKLKQKNRNHFYWEEILKIKLSKTAIEYQDLENKYQFLKRPVVEAYDIGVAVRAVQLLNLQLNKQEIEASINKTQIPGRYDIVQTAPKIIVDGAHNLQAMTNLLHLIRKENQGQIYILLGMMKDKDLGPVTNYSKMKKLP